MTTSDVAKPSRLLSAPLPNLASWTAWCRDADVPVLRESADALEAFRAHEDDTDANCIGEMISGDPLLTLKVLAFEAQHRGARVVTAAETVTAAVVMMGVTPFFHAFGRQPAVEDRLQNEAGALEGLRSVIARSHRGADLALAFAIHRSDSHAALIHTATLLRDFAEMLLWCHAPQLAQKLADNCHADPARSCCEAQRGILNITLAELQASLTAAWHLPTLLALVDTDARRSDRSISQTVDLASRLARHSAHECDHAAIIADIDEAAQLLNLSPAAARDFVRHQS